MEPRRTVAPRAAHHLVFRYISVRGDDPRSESRPCPGEAAARHPRPKNQLVGRLSWSPRRCSGSLLVPAAPAVTSSGLVGSRPLYSRIRTSTKAAAWLNPTVTVLLPPAMFS